MTAIPCAIVRGGTSKGIFILEEHLPADPSQRDRVLLALMGSPDTRQIDGLGGADPLTSKVAIVSRSRRKGIDVEYESVEVGIAEAQVNHGIMCGNLAAGVGCFAIAEGLVRPKFPLTTINIYCHNNHKVIVAKIPFLDATHSMLPTMTGMNTMVSLVFCNPDGATTGTLLPAGEPATLLSLDNGKSILVSIVDAGTLYAFVRADAMGLTGSENAAALDGNAHFRTTMELLRLKVADCINQHGSNGTSVITSRQVKMAVISPPDRQHDSVDIMSRVVNTATIHKAYAVSAGICLAAAATIQGTLVNEIVRPRNLHFTLRIGHPSGILPLLTHWSQGIHGTIIHATELQISARVILRGTVYIFPEISTSRPAKVSDDDVRNVRRVSTAMSQLTHEGAGLS